MHQIKLLIPETIFSSAGILRYSTCSEIKSHFRRYAQAIRERSAVLLDTNREIRPLKVYREKYF